MIGRQPACLSRPQCDAAVSALPATRIKQRRRTAAAGGGADEPPCQCAAARLRAGERLLTTASHCAGLRLGANLPPEAVRNRQAGPCSSDTPRFLGVIGERPAFQRPL